MEKSYDIQEDLILPGDSSRVGPKKKDPEPEPEVKEEEPKEEDVPEEVAEEEPQEEKKKPGRPKKEVVEEDPPAKPGPRGKSPVVWACVECGMSWNKPKLSCSVCGGPVQRMSADTVKDFVFKNRRRRGISRQ
jgi:rubrerythrin